MPGRVQIEAVGDIPIWQFEEDPTFFFYCAGMAIDADGAPNAYHPEPDADLGLDDLGNAGYLGNWWALATDTGEPTGTPVIQGDTDPAPGYYVSMTSLVDPEVTNHADPRRYVDATRVPYIVIPGHTAETLGAQLGDFALVVNAGTPDRTTAVAILADLGPDDKLGEGSVALADILGLENNPRAGGATSDIIYVVFPGSGDGFPHTAAQTASKRDALEADLVAIGGLESIIASFTA